MARIKVSENLDFALFSQLCQNDLMTDLQDILDYSDGIITLHDRIGWIDEETLVAVKQYASFGRYSDMPLREYLDRMFNA